MEYLILSLNIFFAMMFYISSISKMFSYYNFLESIRDFNIPKKYINIIGILIVGSELLLALLFLSNYYFLAYIGVITILIIFIIELFMVNRMNKKIKCSCFGYSNNFTNIKLAILRNILLISFAFLGIYLSRYYSLRLTNLEFVFLNTIIIIIAMIYQLFKEVKQVKKSGSLNL